MAISPLELQHVTRKDLEDRQNHQHKGDDSSQPIFIDFHLFLLAIYWLGHLLDRMTHQSILLDPASSRRGASPVRTCFRLRLLPIHEVDFKNG
jgi:hypothetical protein